VEYERLNYATKTYTNQETIRSKHHHSTTRATQMKMTAAHDTTGKLFLDHGHVILLLPTLMSDNIERACNACGEAQRSIRIHKSKTQGIQSTKTNPCRSWLMRSSSSRRCYPAAMSASSNTREPSDPQAPTPQMSSHTKYRRPTSLERCFMENVSHANMPCDNWQSESYAHLVRYECHKDMETH
jgi:hypothetical protein